jgi:DNA-binding transcriptional regulator YhcF (GntR family)
MNSPAGTVGRGAPSLRTYFYELTRTKEVVQSKKSMGAKMRKSGSQILAEQERKRLEKITAQFLSLLRAAHPELDPARRVSEAA